MKRWPWRSLLVCFSVVLMLVGIAPLAYLFWLGNRHNLEPLSIPLSLKRGKIQSPFFTTDLDEDYQIDIYFLPSPRTPLDLDWKIVDDTGAVIRGGDYSEGEEAGGDSAALERLYRARRGLRQRIIVNMHRDVQARDAHTRLHIGLPETGLERAYGFAFAIWWAAIVAGGGTFVLLILAILLAVRLRIRRLSQSGS